MKLFKSANLKYKADPYYYKISAILLLFAFVSFPWVQTVEFFKASQVGVIATAEASPYAQPIVDKGFFLTKTTWPDYKDTVSAEQYANQSQFDRTHLGPCSNDKPCEKPKSFLDNRYNLPAYLTK
ncbi:hypothetical protein [Xanthomonas phage BUDD]|nr:hypothetical protein [Xanthomonas phage BUDD]